jgi:diadenosine tetraphosphate (Ap4A) HIT family hydrolase
VTDCLFCQPDTPANRVLARYGAAYARHDNYPATHGHIEVLPLRHVASVVDLTPTEILDMHTLIRQHITGSDADGWTIGINEGGAAGRTVDHVHMHLIPRWWGDVPDPRGGVRHVLPGTDPDAWAPVGARQDGVQR